jgi:CTP synthase (UTP-ammonia lyase)
MSRTKGTTVDTKDTLTTKIGVVSGIGKGIIASSMDRLVYLRTLEVTDIEID